MKPYATTLKHQLFSVSPRLLFVIEFILLFTYTRYSFPRAFRCISKKKEKIEVLCIFMTLLKSFVLQPFAISSRTLLYISTHFAMSHSPTVCTVAIIVLCAIFLYYSNILFYSTLDTFRSFAIPLKVFAIFCRFVYRFIRLRFASFRTQKEKFTKIKHLLSLNEISGSLIFMRKTDQDFKLRYAFLFMPLQDDNHNLHFFW